MSNTVRNLPDWIDGFIQYTENTEPPYTYRLWVAISCIAAVLKRKCRMVWGSETWYPNMYIILVGPSGKARKGTAMKPGEAMLRTIGIPMAAEAITREALIREMKKSLDQTRDMISHTSLTVFSKELTVFLGYQNYQLLSDLTDWYDCSDSWTYRTKTQGTDELIGVFLNLIGATTPDLIQTALPPDAIGGGLTSRIIFVYEQSKAKSVPAPTLDMNIQKPLLLDLQHIHMLQGEFTVTELFTREWIDWYIKNDTHPPFDDRRLAGYCERRATHMMKLCMISNASRGDTMLLEPRDLERAGKILTQVEAKMPYTFSGVGKSNIADIMSRVMAELAIQGEMTFGELMSRFYQDADKFTMERIVETIDSMGYAEIGMKNNERIIRYMGKSL